MGESILVTAVKTAVVRVLFVGGTSGRCRL